MRKIMLKWLAIFALASLTTAALANPEPNSYRTTAPQPIIQTKSKMTAQGFGPSTSIEVINYTNYAIIVNYPTYNVLPPQTSTRISNETWYGDTTISIVDYLNPSAVIYRYPVPHHATVEVHFNGQYVVTVTNN